MNIGVLMFFWISVLGSLGYILKSGIAVLNGRSIFIFFEVSPYCFPQRLHQSVFPPLVHEGSPFSTSSPALADLLVIAILTDVRWYPIVVLICISLLISVMSIFSYMYWPSVCPLWISDYSDTLSIFLIGLFAFVVLSFTSSL